jgi:hypothetical protein
MKRNQSREDLRADILLSLGEPYITVNLSEDHLDQAINTALKYFFKMSPYGSYESHYIYTVTDTDVTNGWLPVPKWIDSVVEIIRQGIGLSDNFMTVEYQMGRAIGMSMMNSFNSVSLTDYVCMKERLYNMQQVLSNPLKYTYVRFQRRIIPDFPYLSGDTIAMKCYENVDPEGLSDDGNTKAVASNDIWDDEILKALAVALAKQTWGGIMRKFGNVSLPGGVTLNGDEIYKEGNADVIRITENMLYSSPVDFMMG